jgi:hypothetical protein
MAKSSDTANSDGCAVNDYHQRFPFPRYPAWHPAVVELISTTRAAAARGGFFAFDPGLNDISSASQTGESVPGFPVL